MVLVILPLAFAYLQGKSVGAKKIVLWFAFVIVLGFLASLISVFSLINKNLKSSKETWSTQASMRQAWLKFHQA